MAISFVLDAHPFPFSDRDAQQLHLALCELYPSGRAASLLAKQTGLNDGSIFIDQAPMLAWMEILEQASLAGLTRALVKNASERLSPTSPYCGLFDRLLQNVSNSMRTETPTLDAVSQFLEGTDDVAYDEALLYYDDLTIQTGRLPALVVTLEKLIRLSPAICRLEVDFAGKGVGYGTAFRIGKDLLLTNWHVLFLRDGNKANAVTAEFGYEDDGAGQGLAPNVIACDVDTIVTSQDDDWGVIRVKTPMVAEVPILTLRNSPVPTKDSPAFIIQHPKGARKRLGFVRNQISHVDDRVVHYFTDTQVGSSGAPVLDADGRLIALHHVGGRPQEVIGKPPLKKNEGIRISRIVAGLSDSSVHFD